MKYFFDKSNIQFRAWEMWWYVIFPTVTIGLFFYMLYSSYSSNHYYTQKNASESNVEFHSTYKKQPHVQHCEKLHCNKEDGTLSGLLPNGVKISHWPVEEVRYFCPHAHCSKGINCPCKDLTYDPTTEYAFATLPWGQKAHYWSLRQLKKWCPCVD